MKIEFELPEWAHGRHIRIFAGAELLGAMNAKVRHENGGHVVEYEPLRIKPEDGRCNGCGSCCSTSGIGEKMLQEMADALQARTGAGCPFLGDNGCILQGNIPFACAKSVCTDYPNCTEKLVVVE